MNTRIFNIIAVSFAIIFSFLLIAGAFFIPALFARAESPNDIVFPVAELGDCANESQCKAYCDDFSHAESCISFAEKHNLMTKAEVEEARHFSEAGISEGPGGCGNKDECESYCDNISHIQECVAFGERHGLISDDELKEAKQVAAAVAGGAKMPGGCQNKNECEAYCEEGEHMGECLAFAEAAGFIHGDELAEARRVVPLMQKGESPGGCTSRRQCDAYCDDDSHLEECIAFAEKAGFIDAKDAEMARKTGGKGPGGCKRDECETYCDNPAHQEECFAFAKEHGLISDDELREMERGMGEFRRALEEAPQEVLGCLNDALGAETLAKIKSGNGFPPRDAEPKIRGCFEKMGERERNKFFEFINNAPPEVVSCVLDKIGVGDVKDIKLDSPESGQRVEEAVRGCFEKFGRQEGDFMMDDGMMNDEFHEGDFRGGPGTENMIFDRIPPEAAGCVREKFGGDFGERVSSGDISQEDISSVASDCMRNIIENRAPRTNDDFNRDFHPEEFEKSFRQENIDDIIEHGVEKGFEPFEQFEHNDTGVVVPEQIRQDFNEKFNTFEAEYQRQFEERYQEEVQKQFNDIQNTQSQFQSFEAEPRSFESFGEPIRSLEPTSIQPTFEQTDDFIKTQDGSFIPQDGSFQQPTEEQFFGEPQSRNGNVFLGNVISIVSLLFGL